MHKKLRILVMAAICLVVLLFASGCGQQEAYDSNDVNMHESTAGAETFSSSEPADSTGDIGYEQVVAIALAKVPGASGSAVSQIERDNEDGRIIYEGEIVYGGYEYEFEIDGATGSIIKWEIDD